jgi:hypothetical protein
MIQSNLMFITITNSLFSFLISLFYRLPPDERLLPLPLLPLLLPLLRELPPEDPLLDDELRYVELLLDGVDELLRDDVDDDCERYVELELLLRDVDAPLLRDDDEGV